ncbi:AfsR/SARP family transcriptional regulator [Streptacidiphilus neutrinimicus]|uniref:AfsR/SARP family transcriptional regulator n=1 Tax=Streptacidiphilus neutrinimicus TaxID=105420 RepID=UPI000694BCE2|nr:BTAD domain-containing putative transcriptional regulator [Streptacidiphilus neutrinimicus]
MSGVGGSAGKKLEFALLGEVVVRRDGDPLNAGSPQQRAVLVRLLLAQGKAVAAQELVDALWGEDSPARAVGTVRTYVSRLRTLLAPEAAGRDRVGVLVSVGDGYALRLPPHSITDVVEFERLTEAGAAARTAGDAPRAATLLTQALALWGGEPLAGVPGPFAERERDRLAQARLSVLESLAGAEADSGNDDQVLALLGPLVAEHPLRERPRAALMLALYRSGRQAEALALFDAGRRLLIDELGIEPGPELTDLHRRILAGDPSLLATEGRRASDSAPVEPEPDPVPAQLPSDTLDFTGRAALVESICHSLVSAAERSAVTLHGLSGIGGVGKTTLAVRIAHRVRAAFPDGQLYAELSGTSPGPADPAAVLGDFLLALGVPAAQLPDATAQRAALLRSRLADRRVLIVLDNARDAAQILPLIPGTSGSAVLVTSRARLAGIPGALLTELTALAELEALELLAAVAGFARVAAEGAAATELVAACAHLPLAVRIVASRLATRPRWTVASLLDRLRDEQRRLAELRVGDLAVESTFELGYRLLSERQAWAFRLLSIPAVSWFSLSAAAAVLELPLAEAEVLTESLVDSGLLEAESAGRYRYHDLVRVFARARARASEPEQLWSAAVLRLLEQQLEYVCTAWRAANEQAPLSWRLHPPRPGTDDEATRFGDAALEWVTLRGDRTVLHELAQQILRVEPRLGMRPLVDLLLAWVWLFEDESAGPGLRDILPAAALAAERTDDPRALSRLRYLTGLRHSLAGRVTEAESEFRVALALLPDDESLEIRYTLVAELAVNLNAAGRAEEALKHLRLARSLAAQLGNVADEARLLGNIARGELTAGRPDPARQAAEEGLATALTSGSRRSEADARYQLGIVLSSSGDTRTAIAHFAEALSLYRAQQRLGLEALVLARLAHCRLDLGEARPAQELAARALDLLDASELHYHLSLARWAMGRALLALGDGRRATDQLTLARDGFQRLGAPEASEVGAVQLVAGLVD